jgi:hypothetical protein
MNITANDLHEFKVWKKREYFMKMFFEIHEAQPKDDLISIRQSYEETEIKFVSQFGGRAYLSVESFQRTYYYFLNEKQTK